MGAARKPLVPLMRCIRHAQDPCAPRRRRHWVDARAVLWQGRRVQLRTMSAGSYPRIGDASEQQRLRRAYAQLETGAIAESHSRAVEDAVASDVLSEQAAAGVDVVTDGLVRWHDPISHTARRLAGVTINGLLRFFDNN